MFTPSAIQHILLSSVIPANWRVTERRINRQVQSLWEKLQVVKSNLKARGTCYLAVSFCNVNNRWCLMPISSHWEIQNAAAAAKSLQPCPTLCDPTDSSPPGSPVPGILQASTLEWVDISFSNAWKWKVKVKSLSHVRLLATPWTAAYQAPPSMGFSRQEYWSGVPSPSLGTEWWYSNSIISASWLKYLKKKKKKDIFSH